ncbi:hypothetical protein BGZ99_005606 [Dissophora globulifera]|uniref:Uncharacterized protein n=1 Tax=Dissophora globulifera TaxID=979702 RepID=A0A9P6RGL2_9FUNG|nr:hypothetical protein BGZ99_005606 [Dissophora globulifera]
MTSVSASPQTVPGPHVKTERKATLPARGGSSTNVVSPSSPTQPQVRPALPTNRRYSNVQSKVGSLDTIHYKPKASEKRVQSFKQDFSHVKSKVDAKLILPPTDEDDGTDPASKTTTTATPRSPRTSIAAAAASRPNGVATSTRPSYSITKTTSSATSTASQPKPLSRSASTSSNASSVRTAATSPPSSATTTRSSPRSPAQSPTRHISKNIIPTQKLQFDHVKSKVGSFDNISYAAARGRTSSSHSSSAEDEGGAGTGSRRSHSPSAMSSTSSGERGGATSPPRRSGFKIPTSRKIDYSKVQSKVGSLDYVHHVPQGGNLKVFSEKLSFREQAQSKIAKEINSGQVYQSDQSFDTSTQEAGEHLDGEYDQSIIYGSEADAEDFEPPKNILTVLQEVTESVGDMGLQEQEHGHEAQGAQLESVAAL